MPGIETTVPPTTDLSTTTIASLFSEGIAVGRTFPFMGDADSTWANVEETIRTEVGGPYPLRRNNRQKVSRLFFVKEVNITAGLHLRHVSTGAVHQA